MSKVGAEGSAGNICRTCQATGLTLALRLDGKRVLLEPRPIETRAPKLRGRPRGGWVTQNDLAGGLPRAFRVERPTSLIEHKCRAFSATPLPSERKASTRPGVVPRGATS